MLSRLRYYSVPFSAANEGMSMQPPIAPPNPNPSHEFTALLSRAAEEFLDALDDVDTEILSLWVTTGISLFKQERLPRLSTVTLEARKVLLVVVYERYGGNITHVANALGASRRSVRQLLRRAGVHDGPTVVADRAEMELEPKGDESEPRSSDGAPVEVADDDEDGETHPIRVEDDDER